MLAMFNPAAATKMYVEAMHAATENAFEFWETALNAQAGAVVQMQQAYLNALTAKPPPEYSVSGNVVFAKELTPKRFAAHLQQ